MNLNLTYKFKFNSFFYQPYFQWSINYEQKKYYVFQSNWDQSRQVQQASQQTHDFFGERTGLLFQL